MSATFSTKLIEGEAARLEVDGAELRVTAGPDRGAKIALSGDSVLIGSGPRSNLVLHDATVSARHAEVRLTSRGYIITDLGSTNRILLGGHIVERAVLEDGMRLQLGESAIAVKSAGGRIRIPLERRGQSGGLLAHSVKMRAFVAQLDQVAASDVTVLLEGETGVGKEVAAQEIHARSRRRQGPFVVFDCGTSSHALASASLFGHTKGAFTGADNDRAGLFEEAEGGTLFIDEVGELPLELQPLFLGAIERKRTRRIGGCEDVSHDVRIIAATNRNLGEEVRERRFREDLFHRLAVARLRIPPLRERAEDLPFLAERFAIEHGLTLSPEVLVPFATYEWPGNIRELRNTIARLAVRPDVPLALEPAPRARNAGAASSADRLVDDRGELVPFSEVRARQDALEREYIEAALKIAEGNLSRAAKIAGIARQYFTTLAQKYGFHRPGDSK